MPSHVLCLPTVSGWVAVGPRPATDMVYGPLHTSVSSDTPPHTSSVAGVQQWRLSGSPHYSLQLFSLTLTSSPLSPRSSASWSMPC